MSIIKFVVLAMLALAVLALPVAGVFAGESVVGAGDHKPVEVDTSPGIMAVGDNVAGVDIGAVDGAGAGIADCAGEAAYSKFSGAITLIGEWQSQRFIRVTNVEGGDVDFLIDEDRTVFSDLNGLAGADALIVGADVDAYYTAPLIVSLQYPARYAATVVVVKDAGSPRAAFVGIVDDEGRASDGSIVLNVSYNTTVVMQSGGAVPGGTPPGGGTNNSGSFGAAAFMGRAIIAYYAITTRSLPPIAQVEDAVVLDKLGVPLFVNGARLHGAEAVVKPDGTIMLPLRAVAESLGHSIAWDAETNTARVGVAIYVTIGSDEYAVGRAVPTKLDAAAELIDDRTYAPLSFYTQILNMEFSNDGGLVQLSHST